MEIYHRRGRLLLIIHTTRIVQIPMRDNIAKRPFLICFVPKNRTKLYKRFYMNNKKL